MPKNKRLLLPILLLFGVTFTTSCKYYPDRKMILDGEKGVFKIDSEDLVIVEFSLVRVGPIQYRHFLVPLSEATTEIQFPPVTEKEFNDSTLEFKKIFLDAWAIDTLRNLEYFFSRSYATWGQIRKDTALSSNGISGPKYDHLLK